MRLRTLPLSLAGVILGLLLACADYHVRWTVILFTLLTTVCLQVLCNVANELGDFQKGIDTGERRGPAYTLSVGLLSPKDFKIMIYVYTVLSVVFGLGMIYSSFGSFFALESLMIMLLGVATITAALRYTLGRNPYGYRGLGDLYVFLFFGIVACSGAYFIAAHTLHWKILLPTVAIGCFSVGVLNINNIRDIVTDEGKRITIPLKIGETAAKWYQTALIVVGWVCMLVYSALRVFDIWHYLFVLSLPLFVRHLVGLWKNTGKGLDPMLPLLVMASFLFSLLVGFGYLVYLL